MTIFTSVLFAPRGRWFWTGLLLAGVLAVQACTSITTVQSNNPDPDKIATLESGHHKRADVLDILGSPSSISAFKPETWLYISKKTERVAFLEPEVVESKIIALTFDENGTLQTVQSLDKDDRRTIDMVERSTPTAGNEMGVLEQLIGNFGRFNQPEKQGVK